MLISDCKRKSIKLLNNYSNGGNVVPDSDLNQQDYLLRMNDFIDESQKDIATTTDRKLNAVMRISQYPTKNLLANPDEMFNIKEHVPGTDDTFITLGGKCFTFSVDYLADVYVEEEVNGSWVPLPTPVHLQQSTKPEGYIRFYGFIVPLSASNNIRLRFSGNYNYRFRDVGIYSDMFADIEDIPPYTRFNVYKMPADFYMLRDDKPTFKGNPSDGYPYVKTANYHWEYDDAGGQYIAIDYYNKGEYSINYFRYPVTVDDSTLDTYVMENTIDAQECVPFYVAGHSIMAEDSSIGTQLINEYEVKKSRLIGNETKGSDSFENSSGW